MMQHRITFDLKMNRPLRRVAADSVRVRTVDTKATLERQNAIISDSLKAIRGELDSIRRSHEGLQKETLEIAMKICRCVFDDSQLTAPRVESFVKTALRQFEPDEDRRVFVSADCVDTVNDLIATEEIHGVSVAVDENIAPGDCRVESGDIGVEAILDNLLDAIRDSINVEGDRP